MQDRPKTTPDLFTPIDVGPLRLPNRVVMAPLTRSRAGPGNVPTQLNALYYAQRASAGLIISEATQISPEGQGYISTPGIHSAEQIDAARGQHRSQQLFAELLSETERANKQQSDEWLQTAIEYKHEWEQELARRAALGINGP